MRWALNGIARGLQRDVKRLGAVKHVEVVVVRPRHDLSIERMEQQRRSAGKTGNREGKKGRRTWLVHGVHDRYTYAYWKSMHQILFPGLSFFLLL